MKNFVSQRFFLIDCFLFLNAVKSTPKTPPTIADPNCFILLLLSILCFLRSSVSFCSRSRLLSSSNLNFLSGGFAGRKESFPWRYVLTCFGISSPPSKGDASRALIPAVKKACCAGWLAMPCRSSGTRGLTNDGGSCGKPEPVIFLRASFVYFKCGFCFFSRRDDMKQHVYY